MSRRRIAVAILGLVILAAPAAAQQRPVNIAVSGGPDELTVPAGATGSTSMIVRNPADYAQDVEVIVTGLSIRDGDYSMDGDPPRGMDVTVRPATFTVPANGAQDVFVDVQMAADAEPGGNYAGVVVRGLPAAESGVSPVTAEIALPLLVTVPGEVVEDGAIRSFGPDDPTVRIGADATFTVGFENTGNVHYPVAGTLQLFDGPRPLGVVDVPESAVLPRTTRDIAVVWPAVAPAGTIRAVLNLTWGKQGQFADTRESAIELVESDDDDGGDGPVVVTSSTGEKRNVALPAGLALGLLVLMLALLFRAALQRDRQRRGPLP